MKCAIYKSHRRADTYLYVEAEVKLMRVPEALLNLLGRLELVMTLELTPGQTLARADPNEVCRQLTEQGYYLQLPPGDFSAPPN